MLIFFLFFKLTKFLQNFLLEYNHFTMLYSFLPHNKVNQLQVYIYPLLLEPPSLSAPPSRPSRSSQSPELGSLFCVTASLLAVYLTHGGVYTSSYSFSLCPLCFPHCVHRSALHLGLHSCPANRFISLIFLDSMYVS